MATSPGSFRRPAVMRVLRADGEVRWLLALCSGRFLQPGGAGHRWRRRGYQPGPFSADPGPFCVLVRGRRVGPSACWGPSARDRCGLSGTVARGTGFVPGQLFRRRGPESVPPGLGHPAPGPAMDFGRGRPVFRLPDGSFGRNTNQVRRPSKEAYDRPGCRAAGHLDRGCCEAKRPAGPPSEVSRLGRPCTRAAGLPQEPPDQEVLHLATTTAGELRPTWLRPWYRRARPSWPWSLDATASSSASSRGSQTRQRLQAELASQSGAFAEKVKERAQVRMSPAGVGSTEPFSLCRYNERFGGFSRHREMALVAWQVAISFDLLMAGRTNAAADTLGLLALYIDQLVLDQGSTTLAWLLTLQHDPPQALFSEAVAAPAPGSSPSPLWQTRSGSPRPWATYGRWT